MSKLVSKCMWFIGCTRRATTYRPHPLLQAIPICAECNAKLDRIEAASVRPNAMMEGTNANA